MRSPARRARASPSAATPPAGRSSCAGNPAVRVCAGDGPCAHVGALAENDDACGTSCPSVSCLCPLFRNRYTVMTGAARAGGAYECRLEATEARP